MAMKPQFKQSLPPAEFSESLSKYYLHQLSLFSQKTLFVDYVTGREWNGANIKSYATKFGRYLIEQQHILRGDCCAIFYKNCDYVQILSIGIVFAGASTCAMSELDTINEHKHALRKVKPAIVFANMFLKERLLKLRTELDLSFKICIMNDENPGENLSTNGSQDSLFNESVFGFHKHMLSYDASKECSQQFPAHVEPDDPAYLLFTSGSTGLPKAVIRSHKNSIHVCHSLKTVPQLWDLSGSDCVVAGFQELDHGTGTFCIKMTLANGLTTIVMNGFDLDQLLECIERHQVTDFNIGTAYLHNLMAAYCQAPTRYNLSTLRNVISIGSPLQTHELKRQFMDMLPNVSVRQAYGMTECGFVSMVARDEARTDTGSVGYLLPSVECVKLVDNQSGAEMSGIGAEGELLVRGPTVSPGYTSAADEREQMRFQDSDGFYRTNDLCMFSREGRIHIRGRLGEMLIFTDGWKVLPAEIEMTLMEHPLIQEAAIIGVPHPKLPGCHTPRAYVVPKKAASLTEQQVYDFVAAALSEPKHLNGGVRIMLEPLPKITVGKVDKKALRKMDGL